MLTAKPGEYHANRDKYEGRIVNYDNQPNLVSFEAGDYSLAVFLFMLLSFLHTAGNRSANIINYFPGVDFGPVRFPSRFRQLQRGERNRTSRNVSQNSIKPFGSTESWVPVPAATNGVESLIVAMFFIFPVLDLLLWPFRQSLAREE
jgi:hypothetical protein